MSITVEAPAVDETVEQRLVYRVREDRLGEAREIVEKVNRKAARYGLAGHELVVGEVELVPATRPSIVPGHVEVIPGVYVGYCPVELVGEMPRFEGWSFVASLDYSEEGGVITRPVPGVEVDLSAHRARAAECDYCDKRRHRSATYVWRHADGRMMQVGSTCITPFAGIRVSGLGWLDGDPFAALSELGDEDGEDGEGGGGGSGAAMRLAVAEVLVVTMAVEQVEGWRSRAVASEYGKPSTSALVLDYMIGTDKGSRAFQAHLKVEADWEAAAEKAAKVQSWAVEQDGDSEWAQNLRTLAGAETVGLRNVGLLASAVAGYNRETAQRVERDQRAEPVHVGAVKGKVAFAGEVVHSSLHEGYGYHSPDRNLLLIRGEADGQPVLVKWWASSPQGLDIGAKVTGTATVKAHETYKGEAQTVVIRAKLFEN